MSDRLVPWSNRTLYIPNEYFKLLALSDQFISIEALGKKSVSKGEVGEIDNMVVKRVPPPICAGVYFLVKYKGSTVDPVKLNDMKIHQDPPGIGRQSAGGGASITTPSCWVPRPTDCTWPEHLAV